MTIDDIIAVHGERIPAFGEAQTDLNAAFVVVSSQPLSDVELSFMHHHAESYGAAAADGRMMFAESTGGRATMDTRVRPKEE